MGSSIAVIMTCFNRREKSLACLRALFAQELPDGISVSVFLVDDGSTDGTGDAVRQAFPSVNVLQGDGTLYWNQGMRFAFGEAIKLGFDYYLWLNDDTYIYPDTIKKLLATNVAIGPGQTDRAIIAGSMADPKTGAVTYGGLDKSTFWHRTALRRVPPQDKPQRCLTIHGNCVLVPAAVVAVVGNLSDEFPHSFGDNDYGLRAGKLGINCWIAPGFIGTCTNDHPPLSRYRKLSLRERWRRMTGPTGHPPRAWAVYCKRYAGSFWFYYWCRPYLRELLVLFAPGGALLVKKS